MRKLVTLQTIEDVQPIEGADFIEYISFKDIDWKCVALKGEFKKGDKAIYFEIDSFLPLEPEFEFLRKSSYKKMGEKEGLRLKTIKLRGQISQGLALPLDKLQRFIKDKELKEGEDLSEIFGVEKYEQPIKINMNGVKMKNFPSFIEKTDQERVQTFLKKIQKEAFKKGFSLKDIEFEESLKLDGMSMTVYASEDKEGVCSRNMEIDASEEEENVLWKVAKEQGLIDILKNLREKGYYLAFQGELLGPKIQGNRERLKDYSFFLYDVFDIKKGRKLSVNEKEELFEKEGINIQQCPVYRKVKIFEEFDNTEDLLLHAEGKSLNNNVREGLVYKSYDLINGEQVSFKVISNKFLLKEK